MDEAMDDLKGCQDVAAKYVASQLNTDPETVMKGVTNVEMVANTRVIRGQVQVASDAHPFKITVDKNENRVIESWIGSPLETVRRPVNRSRHGRLGHGSGMAGSRGGTRKRR